MRKRTEGLAPWRQPRTIMGQKPYIKDAHANEKGTGSVFCKEGSTSHARLMSKRLDEEAREGNEERRRTFFLRRRNFGGGDETSKTSLFFTR